MILMVFLENLGLGPKIATFCDLAGTRQMQFSPATETQKIATLAINSKPGNTVDCASDVFLLTAK